MWPNFASAFLKPEELRESKPLIEGLKSHANPSRVFAHAVEKLWMELSTKKAGLRASSGEPSLRKLARSAPDELPGADHSWMLTRNGRVVAYETNPYQIHWDNLRKMVKLAERHGLEINIDSHSFYFPSQTVRIRVTKAKDQLSTEANE